MVVVNVVTIAASLGGFVTRGDWLCPKVGGHLALCRVHQMNRVNSHSGIAMMKAPETLSFTITFTIIAGLAYFLLLELQFRTRS